MTGIPKDERGYEHLVARADALLGHARSAAARAAAPARRASGSATKPRATKPPPSRALTPAQAAESTDARVLLSAVTTSASSDDRRLLMDRLAAIAADPALLSANDAASVPGALRQAQPTVAELAPIVAALMSRQDLRRSKPVLQHLGELCLDRGAVDEAGPVLAELQERFPGDMVVRKLLSRRDELA
jgi:hypothetical protein